MKKLVIFDLDGTLLHTLPDIAENVNITLKHFGVNPLPEEIVKKHIGNGARELIRCCLEEENKALVKNLDVVLEYYNKIYTNSGSEKTHLFIGVSELLVKLKEDGFYLAILTNKPMKTTERVCEKYLKNFGFDIILGATEQFKCKPDKEAIEYIIEKLSVKKENCFMVGDGDADAMVAVNANVRGVSVLWGYRDKDTLEKAGGKNFVNTPEELYKFITLAR